jgi:CheY-like chemotaxis protein
VENASINEMEALARANHDLRSPLHTILALLSLLEETFLTGEQRTLLNNITDSTRQLAELILGFLDLPCITNPTCPLSPSNALEGLFVLMADDDPVNLAVTYRLLEHMGCNVAAVASGRGCIEMLATHPKKYNLVLLDLSMPEMDGFETFAEIQQMPETQRPIVIALTANSDSTTRDKCSEVGMDGVLCKPITVNELRDVLSLKLGPETRRRRNVSVPVRRTGCP